MFIEDLKENVKLYKRLGLSSTLIEKNIKEKLQLLILEIIYGNEKYRNLVFFGGTCLKVCFSEEFQRLSEDLDFIDLEKTNAGELKDFIGLELMKRNLNLDIEIKSRVRAQEFEVSRLHIKFNDLLSKLGLVSNLSNRTMLMIKIEYTFIEKIARLDQNERKEVIIPEVVFKEGYSIVLNRLNNASLMASKMIACKNRKFEKGNTGINIKGRDYFDFVWYMQKGFIPAPFIFSIYDTTLRETLGVIDEIAYKITSGDLKIDIIDLLEDQNFADTFCNQFVEIYKSLRKQYILINTDYIKINIIQRTPKLDDYYGYDYIYKDNKNNVVTFRVIVSRFVFTAFESKIDYNLAIFNHYLEAFKKLNLSNIVTESIFEKILLIFIKENISKYITNFGKDNLVSNATYEMEPMNSDKIKFQTLDDIQDIFSRKTLFKITTPFNNT